MMIRLSPSVFQSDASAVQRTGSEGLERKIPGTKFSLFSGRKQNYRDILPSSIEYSDIAGIGMKLKPK